MFLKSKNKYISTLTLQMYCGLHFQFCRAHYHSWNTLFYYRKNILFKPCKMQLSITPEGLVFNNIKVIKPIIVIHQKVVWKMTVTSYILIEQF
jgi:hypothetical protein